MAWNLVDELTTKGELRRTFYVPLASIPVGQTAVRAIDRTLYAFDEEFIETPQQTSDICLKIVIQIPSGGLIDEQGYPDPLIRLHAIGVGRLQFKPATVGGGDQLILEMIDFALSTIVFPKWIKQWPRWFKRWEDTKSIPLTVIYENVDRAYLQTLLNGISAPVDTRNENWVEPTKGLLFPANVTQGNKAQFITQFLAGADKHRILAQAGAVIGTAATDPTNNAQRLLKLHARYQDHTTANPHPMNPRELFYLLFGDDSTEATTHPLLVRMNEWGQSHQNNVYPEARRMLLRPPLRTWKRVVWEANQEINNYQGNWRPAGTLGPDRLYNTHARDGLSYNRGTYAGSSKCNVFVSDICLRSGFRVCIHGPVGNTHFHYVNPNPYANQVQQAAGGDDRIGLMGRAEDRTVCWGWKIENWLRAEPAANRQQRLNSAMIEEGRCFILVGARGRSFKHQGLPFGCQGAACVAQGLADCNVQIRTNAGHMVIVREVLAQPVLAASAGSGLQRVRVKSMEASSGGAVSRDYDARLGGVGNNPAAGNGFVRLHLIELSPGQDPDTKQGLRNLNVRNQSAPNLLQTQSERAPDRPLTHNPNGTIRPPGHCCHDTWPAGGVVVIQC